ncbi:FtsX-like permease family protein [Micromonospora sp. NPDC049366]|uniref:FtsX-like permease family protein n=1 Tax=Micromonospora sp. NPDC049366 TaxID=3364271 RepID=UPI0037B53C94
MKLVWRRARAARGLLAAAVVAALVAVALVTGLSDYSRGSVAAGQKALLSGAPVEERSLLLTGAAGKDVAEFARRDQIVRDGFAAAFGAAPTTTSSARFGSGRELTGDLGPTTRKGTDPVFANLATLDDLPAHAELASGAWPTPGARPLQVTLPEKVAAALGLTAGARVPMLDRSTDRPSQLVLAGTWRPRDATDAYWRLVPGVGAGSAAESSTSYGPFVLDQADFTATFRGSVSASWVIEPDLTAVDAEQLPRLWPAVNSALTEVPKAADLGSSAQTVTAMKGLLDRISRADLVGRSSLATPLLLIVVLGGYALVLVAALLNEDRRGQTALLRARGAARRQLAGLAAREATLVVLPAALLGPLLAAEALRHTETGRSAGTTLIGGDATLLWAAALATALGCLVAMVAPTLRGAGTYVADMEARSRPNRAASVQRASLDVLLVALAVLAWTQLRQYDSPLAGAGESLGLDPLLVAAPTLGVLAGAAVALRLLPPATRFAERFVHRRLWTATVLGMWQAGRRPHAGPVLLLALAVGGSTLAWSLVSTGERSQVEQADHTVGADLRLTERVGSGPAGRAAELAALPGVQRVLPAWRDEVRLGRASLPATVVSIDTASANGVVRLSDRLADAPAPAVFERLARERSAPAGLALPPGTRTLTGTVSTPVGESMRPQQVAVTVLLTRADGLALRLPAATADSSGRSVPFRVQIPEGSGDFRLAGFVADAGEAAGTSYQLNVTGVRTAGTDGAARPLDLGKEWMGVSGDSNFRPPQVTAGATGLRADHPIQLLPGGRWAYQASSRFAVVPTGRSTPVPALMTPAVREALSLKTGDMVNLPLSGVTLPVKLVGDIDAVPATAGNGVLLDLPAAVDWLVRNQGSVRPVPEWWVSTDEGGHTEARRAADGLTQLTVVDRREVAEAAAHDPYWRGARTALLAAALGSVLLALVGLMVDVWATARHRLTEFAVLNTLGATPRLLARALLAEQTFLAGIGVGVGLLLGAGVGATMAPLVILTPAAGRPVPEAAFTLPWLPIGLTALGLLLAALAFSAFIAVGIRQRVASAQLRIGGER